MTHAPGSLTKFSNRRSRCVTPPTAMATVARKASRSFAFFAKAAAFSIAAVSSVGFPSSMGFDNNEKVMLIRYACVSTFIPAGR
jgi:hypothetical protein